ncbi:MAG: ChbG/HpnK family deacetylase [Gemmataceae bacterium]|nr:ChbG/HpnK family deacetylase [Gemmataceae bacterium]
MALKKNLVVIADDFGIGPKTSEGILQAFRAGSITATVLIVTSPFAQESIECWRQEGLGESLGWHPNLTLDSPVLPPGEVPSLVDEKGKFHSLGKFLWLSFTGKIRTDEVNRELRAQLARFKEWTGYYPVVVNSHQHIAAFSAAGKCLIEIFQEINQRPFFRRVREPWETILCSKGARIKRAFLSWQGKKNALLLKKNGFPGADCLLGICDYRQVGARGFLEGRLNGISGPLVEWMAHPGLPDCTLEGRDAPKGHSALAMRYQELRYFCTGEFQETAEGLGFNLLKPGEIKKLVA